MKRFIVAFTCALAMKSAANAQELYGRLGVGYAIPSAGQMNDLNGFPYSGTINGGTVSTYNIKSASFTSGFQGNFAFGYMFNSHIGIEANLHMTALPVKYTAKAHNVLVQGIPSDYTIVNQALSPTFLIPSLVMQTGETDFSGYLRFGLVLPLRTTITQDLIVTNLPGTGAIYTDDYVFEIKNSFSLGFAAAAGFKYKLNYRSTFWAELGFMSLSVLVRESNLIAVYENGDPIDLSYVSGTKKTVYSKTAAVDSDYSQQPTYALPFSNAGLQVGVIYNLGGGHHQGKNDIKDRRKKF